jgi:hypothetical protein
VKQAVLRMLTLPALIASSLAAHDIITTNLTYTRDVSRILARRCVECHAASSAIPLTNYEEVRPWAVDIKEQVLSRAMPPWGAVKGFGNLSPDHALTQEEIVILSAWVVGGAPKGDPALLPKTQPANLKPAPALKDALSVSTRATLNKPLSISGIRPLPAKIVDSARITARLPDGRIEPLVWLYGFDPKTNITFHFRDSLQLPAGTVVESSEPLQFALETSRPTDQARR